MESVGQPEEGKRLVYKPALCTGCRSCMLFCSFRLGQVCSPELARLHISRNLETGETTCLLPERCDACADEDSPPCVEACLFGALKVRSTRP